MNLRRHLDRFWDPKYRFVLTIAVGQGLLAFLSLVFVFFLLRVLSLEEFGLYAYSIAIGSFLGLLISYGHGRAFFREWNSPRNNRNDLKYGLYYHRIITFGLLFSALVGLQLWFASDDGYFVTLIILAIVAQNGCVPGYFDAIGKTGTYCFVQISIKIAFYVLIIVGVYSLSVSKLLVVSFGLFVCEVSFLVFQLLHLRSNTFRSESGPRNAYILFKREFLVFFGAISGLCFVPLTQVAIKEFFGALALGVFAAALVLTRFSVIISQLYCRAVKGTLADIALAPEWRVKLVRVLKVHGVTMASILLLLYGPMFIFAELISVSVFKDKNISVGLIRVVSVYSFMLGIGIVGSMIMHSFRKDRDYISILWKAVAFNFVCICFGIINESVTVLMYGLVLSHSSAIVIYYFQIGLMIYKNENSLL